MVRHPTSKRVHRTGSDEAEDVFIAQIVGLGEWARRNARLVIGVGIAAAVVLAGIVYYASRRTTLRELAQVELAEVRQTAASGNAALAVRDLDAFLERFGGTTAAAEARLLIAQLHLQEARPDPAIEALEPLAGQAGLMGTSGKLLLAAAWEMKEDTQRAETLYLEIADRGALEFQRLEALEDAARLRMQTGNAAGAAELYRRLLDRLEEDAPDRGIYEMRLAEAEAAAAAGAAGQG